MMEQNALDGRVGELRVLKADLERMQSRITEIEDELKNEMIERGEYTLTGIDWKITWNEVTSTRFNQKGFKESNPELYNEFLVTNESRRFLLKY